MAQGDDEEDEEITRLIRESYAEAAPEIRARSDELRREISAFFGISVEHLPPAQTLGWHRLLATYVYGWRKPDLPYAAENLRLALKGTLYTGESRA